MSQSLPLTPIGIHMEPIFLTINEACQVLRNGRTALYDVVNSGALPARKRGSRTLIHTSDVKQYADSLPKIEAPPKSKKMDPWRKPQLPPGLLLNPLSISSR